MQVVQITSFIPEVSSKASIVVAEADLLLGWFWAMCSNSVETLKRGLPLSLFSLENILYGVSPAE